MFNTIGKVLWHSGAALFWFAVVVGLPFILILGWMMAPCSGVEHSELQAVDSDLSARVVVQNCGATTNWRTWVVVTDSSGYQSGKVLTLEGHPDASNLQLRWDGASHLELSGFDWRTGYPVSERAVDSERFTVSYQPAGWAHSGDTQRNAVEPLNLGDPLTISATREHEERG